MDLLRYDLLESDGEWPFGFLGSVCSNLCEAKLSIQGAECFWACNLRQKQERSSLCEEQCSLCGLRSCKVEAYISADRLAASSNFIHGG